MNIEAQKNATRNYRARLAQRGVKRFEVMAPETDRNLIRALGQQLAADGPKAEHARTTVKALIADTPLCARWYSCCASSLAASRCGYRFIATPRVERHRIDL